MNVFTITRNNKHYHVTECDSLIFFYLDKFSSNEVNLFLKTTKDV